VLTLGLSEPDPALRPANDGIGFDIAFVVRRLVALASPPGCSCTATTKQDPGRRCGLAAAALSGDHRRRPADGVPLLRGHRRYPRRDPSVPAEIALLLLFNVMYVPPTWSSRSSRSRSGIAPKGLAKIRAFDPLRCGCWCSAAVRHAAVRGTGAGDAGWPLPQGTVIEAVLAQSRDASA
jgi:hypothetical protein